MFEFFFFFNFWRGEIIKEAYIKRGEGKLIIKLKKEKTNSSINYNDKFIINLKFSIRILRKLVSVFRISTNLFPIL